MLDAAYPPYNPPSGIDVTAFYIGGDAVHLWTDAEIRNIRTPYALPIYVCDKPALHSGYADGTHAGAWMQSHGIPDGASVGLDLETAVDPAYVSAFSGAVSKFGYRTIPYGSKSSLFQNPKCYGYWVADYTEHDHLYPGTIITQYYNGPTYDLSEVAPGVALWNINPVEDTQEMLSMLKLDAGLSYLPVPYVGTNPKSLSVRLTAQSEGQVDVYWGRGGKWVQVASQAVTYGGSLRIDVPTDGSVDLFKIQSKVPLVGYIFGE